jgi:hypothetical protein
VDVGEKQKGLSRRGIALQHVRFRDRIGRARRKQSKHSATLSRGDFPRLLAKKFDFAIEPSVSDGKKASIPPRYRAGTVPGFLSNLPQKFVYLEKSMAFSATLYASGVFQQIEGQLVRFDNFATI